MTMFGTNLSLGANHYKTNIITAGAVKTLSARSLLKAGRNNYGNETKSKTLATNSKRYLIQNFTQPCRMSHENRKYGNNFRGNALRNLALLHDISYYRIKLMEISPKLRCDHFGAVLY